MKKKIAKMLFYIRHFKDIQYKNSLDFFALIKKSSYKPELI